jgi:hypothetical protein
MRFRDVKPTRKMRKRAKRDTWRCFWCQRNLCRPGKSKRNALMRTRDHYWPKSRGGTAIVPCCYACNQLKKAKTPSEWHQFMHENPQWWTRFA